MNFDLLRFLKKTTEYTPVGTIESKLKLSRGDLFTDVETLLDHGYKVEFHPYLGVRLLDIPDTLTKFEIREDLNTKRIGRKLRIYDEIASTNETAWEHVADDMPDGTVVIAESQTRGRGRMGREWVSASGLGLWLSVICRVNVPADKTAFLTAGTSLAVANMLQQFIQLPAEIKWPNDVMIRGRKACGVLVEARSNHPDVWVVGIGLNVNHTESDFPEELRKEATSLRMERPGGKTINRVRVLRPLLFYLDRVYQQIRKKRWDKITKAWTPFVHMGGKHVSLRHAGEEFQGVVQALDPAEGITLKLDDSEDTRVFRADSVTQVRSTKG